MSIGNHSCPADAHSHIVIVDDNLAYAQNIAEILELMGCFTEVFETAEEALPVALSHEVTAVITDFRLPGMTGLEMVKQIVRERGPVPVLVISAYADEDVTSAAASLGATFLPKPLDLRLFDDIVERWSAHW